MKTYKKYLIIGSILSLVLSSYFFQENDFEQNKLKSNINHTSDDFKLKNIPKINTEKKAKKSLTINQDKALKEVFNINQNSEVQMTQKIKSLHYDLSLMKYELDVQSETLDQQTKAELEDFDNVENIIETTNDLIEEINTKEGFSQNEIVANIQRQLQEPSTRKTSKVFEKRKEKLLDDIYKITTRTEKLKEIK
ncbi:hypothetical protein DZA31_00680 [Arcobacter sp. HD9-500m-PIT-SAG02]|nr:hypothetical protein DZA31_00680 [Arcobacter sp. HD9-500m-PIT-SAG02]RDX34859.1 hypothetical protein DZA35_00935 [Arcobacter sp. HD9-500m-PIT-SAG03]